MMSSLLPQHAPGFASSSSSSPFVSTPTRKRQATADSNISPPSSTKRHKPNLARGFSGLSIGQLNSLPGHPYAGDESDGTDDTATSLPASELAVEEVDATSSLSSSDDSDATFRNTRPQPRRRRAPQRPDTVEHPPEISVNSYNHLDPDVQDMSTPLQSRKRREHDGEVEGVNAARSVKRRREGDMEIDDEIEEIPRPSVRSRTRTQWYEPEKDRIVITSLGSPNSSRSSSRSTSPDSRHLSQPGSQGFTLHPSLLTHLLNTQRDNLHPMPLPKEQSLVLYRPLGLHPDGGPDVVRQWDSEPIVYDSERFEEVNDDETTMQEETAWPTAEEDSGMDVD